MNNKILKEKDFFKTSDLSLAVSLSLFCPLEAIDKPPNSNRGFFMFKISEQLDVLIGQYHKGELRIEPLSYFNQLRHIKTRLYNSE